MKRIEELDFTRIIAMIAVITIHVTSAYIGYQSNILVMGMNVAFILNQLTRFAVPLFILLSGTSLGLSANDDSYREFLHKRLTKIGIPYLAWTAVYIIYNNHSDLSAINFRSVLRTVFGNVKKCAVGKHPKSEKLGSTGQAACCARIHSRYFTGGNPSGLRV